MLCGAGKRRPDSPLADVRSRAPRLPPRRNATLRSKAESRTRTFLWQYGRTVLDHGGVTSREAFLLAVQAYLDSSRSAALEPLEAFKASAH